MRKPDGSIKLFIACIIIITGVLLTIQTFINVSQFHIQASIEKLDTSSQQIADIVQGNLQDMKVAVEASATGAKSVQAGIETVQSADMIFQKIVSTSGRWQKICQRPFSTPY